jgi:hypothetical protein
MAIALREKKAGLSGVGSVRGIMGHHMIQAMSHYRNDCAMAAMRLIKPDLTSSRDF